MASVSIPFGLTYETSQATPISEVIAALRATELAIGEGIALLPSLVDGLEISSDSVHVRMLSQQSPLRELFCVALVIAFQDRLGKVVPPMTESLLGIDVPQEYESVLTICVMVVIFYGCGFVKDALAAKIEDTQLRRILDGLIEEMASVTGKPAGDIRKILNARYSKPKLVKRLIEITRGVFRPSQIDSSAPVRFDRRLVSEEVVREVPLLPTGKDPAFNRYEPMNDVVLDIHAQDRDREASGWAAVPQGVSDRRLKLKLQPPITTAELWGKDRVTADVVLVSKLTATGFSPSEIHLTRVIE